MPNHLKAIVSILALMVTTTVFLVDSTAGAGGAARWVALGLGPLMVLAIWMFPEAKAREVRKAAGRRYRGREPGPNRSATTPNPMEKPRQV